MRLALACCAAAALALAGCSRRAADERAAAQAPAPDPAQKTVIDTQLRALQKAKDVQKTVDQQKRDADAKVADEGG